jgi:beta-lactamase class A
MRQLAGFALADGVGGACLGACSGGRDEPPTGGLHTEGATALGLPANPAGAQLAWVLTEGAAAGSAQLAERFSADFIAAVPAEQVRTVLAELGAATVSEVRSSAPTALAVIVVVADSTSLAARITVEAAEPHRINGLLFQPAELPAAPATWSEVDGRLAALAERGSLVAAEVARDSSLRAVHERDSDAAGPIGSAFKLYVLGALAEAVRGGTMDWDDSLVIQETDRSLPSGRLQDQVGSTVEVREAARLMISISDNTATDLLITQLGRPAVEAVLEPMGVGPASRARTLPFLSTREMFILKWGARPDALAAYASAAEEQRRRLLEDLPTELPPASAVDPALPVEIDRIEWFASPLELAAAQLFLDNRRTLTGLESLGDILGANPGLPLDPATWTRVAFKGGSEPGLLALSWLLERADGRRFVLALVVSDASRPIDQAEGVAIATGAIALLAETG